MAKTIRVMVAEDFPLLREDFCDVVSAQSDMEVVGSAASGEEIASLADTVPCDVILMDIEMETIDAGIRAAEVITARHPEVKILFLTAHETDDMITSAMGTGAVDYVVKGCEVEARLAALHWNIDIVLSHTCPRKYEPTEVFLSSLDQSSVDKSTEDWLDGIEDRLDYKKWYCGHYHTRKQVDKIQFMFEDFDTMFIRL